MSATTLWPESIDSANSLTADSTFFPDSGEFVQTSPLILAIKHHQNINVAAASLIYMNIDPLVLP